MGDEEVQNEWEVEVWMEKEREFRRKGEEETMFGWSRKGRRGV